MRTVNVYSKFNSFRVPLLEHCDAKRIENCRHAPGGDQLRAEQE